MKSAGGEMNQGRKKMLLLNSLGPAGTENSQNFNILVAQYGQLIASFENLLRAYQPVANKGAVRKKTAAKMTRKEKKPTLGQF